MKCDVVISRQRGGSAEGEIDRIVYERFFRDGRPGRAMEVGAARPDWLSIGSYFRERGWDVLGIEPNPHFAEMQRLAGNDVVQCAAGSRDRDDVPFTIVDCHGASYRGGAVSFESWSSLGMNHDFRRLAAPKLSRKELSLTTIAVQVRKLDTILAEHRHDWDSLDLVAVDVEGWELDVLDGLNFGRRRPRVVILENLFHGSEHNRFMRDRGYRLWKTLHPNQVYARSDLVSAGEVRIAEALEIVVAAGLLMRALAARLLRAGTRGLSS